ncbi:hypothetical protein D9M68_566910 [compost metagenome]
MRKVLLTVMMVSSLLAFNACKKDGAVGPVGPVGPAGATGAAGAVGPAGAKGADGTKILSGTVDPTTEGAVGDFYFNKTTKTLWGPKAAAGWAGTGTSLTGTAGSVMLAGSGVPSATAPTNAKEGDYYFDAATSTVWGPKQADGTWLGQIPLASGAGAKNYVFAKGFETIVEGVAPRVIGQSVIEEVSDFTLNTSYAVSANDMIRIAKYPGWINNREMMVAAPATPGVFDVPVTYAHLVGAVAPFAAALPVGTVFVYTNMPTEQFTLTADDIARLTVNAGAAFPYLTYATAQNINLGTNLVLATKKNLRIVNDPTRFATTYTGTTKFDLNTLPGLAAGTIETIKKDGKLFVKYKYFNAKTATGGNTLVNVANDQAGWSDLTVWANSYVGLTGGYTNIGGINPFGGAYSPAQDFMTSGTYFGNGVAATFGPAGTNNNAIGTMDLATTVTNRGKFTVNWTINSGAAAAAAGHTVGDAYYNSANGNLTFQNPGSTTKNAVVGNNITYNDTKGGLEPAALGNIKLVQIQVLAVPAANVTAAKAKGVDVNDAVALGNFIKL